MLICLLRHGETDWNNIEKIQGREDIPLNNTGIRQIEETIGYLKSIEWKVIITSPLIRAKMSAEIISEEIGNINILEELDFVERDYGKASGMTIDEANLIFPDGKWEGIESSEVLQNRTVHALMKYINMYDTNNIIIVSHGSAINSILAYLSKNEIGTGKTILRNACISLLDKTQDRIHIVCYNKMANEFPGFVISPL